MLIEADNIFNLPCVRGQGGNTAVSLEWIFFFFFMGDNIDGLSSANAELASLCHQLEVTFVGQKCSVFIKQNYACCVFPNNYWHESITDATWKNGKIALQKHLSCVETQQQRCSMIIF